MALSISSFAESPSIPLRTRATANTKTGSLVNKFLKLSAINMAKWLLFKKSPLGGDGVVRRFLVNPVALLSFFCSVLP